MARHTQVTDPVKAQTPQDHANILARTIPSGTEGGKLKLTFALRPVKPPATTRGTVALPSWPSTIETLMERCRVEVKLVSFPLSGPATPCNAGKTLVLSSIAEGDQAPTIRPWSNKRGKLADADAMWRRLMPDEAGDFRKFAAALQAFEDIAPEDRTVCLSGKEGDVALLTKMARALEAVRVAFAPDPDEERALIRKVALDQAKAFLNESEVLKTLYDDLDAGENTSTSGQLKQPLNTISITKKKRRAAIDLGFADAAKECGAMQKLGMALANGSVEDCAKTLRERQGQESCAPEHITKGLSAIYRRLLELRIRFLLGSAIGEEEIEQLEESQPRTNPDGTQSPGTDYKPPASAEDWHVGSEPDAYSATARLVALDETPDIGRVMRTFYDVRADFAPIAAALERAGNTSGTAYMFVRLGPMEGLAQGTDAADRHTRWTLAKATFSGSGGTAVPLQFLPATREELCLAASMLQPSDDDVLAQRDGVLLLGGTTANGGPRFELVSADLRAAARDFEKRVDRMMTAVRPAMMEQRSVTESLDDTAAGAEGFALRSGGLSLVAFGCASELSRRVGAARQSANAPCDETYLDADDLLVGRVPFLGIPQGTLSACGSIVIDGYAWRPLTRKRVAYDDPISGVNLEETIKGLYGDGQERERAQSTVDRATPRTAKLRTANGACVNIAAVDEAEISFVGEPMGLDTTMREKKIETNGSIDFPLGRRLTLPRGSGKSKSDDSELVGVLRFGAFSRVGFAAYYLGGATLSAAAATKAFEAIPAAAVPRGCKEVKVAGRRYLRSEPAEAVGVLMPKDEADREANAYRRWRAGGASRPPRFEPQTTFAVTLRSIVADIASELRLTHVGEEEITRVIVPAVLPLTAAEKHGVFDEAPQGCFPSKAPRAEVVERIPRWRDAYHQPTKVVRPADGLRDIHADAAWGGFPVLRRDKASAADRIAIGNAAFDDGRTWLDDAKRWSKMLAEGKQEKPPVPRAGDGVFARLATKTVVQGRTVPIYPDPMAQSLVLRLRRREDPARDADGPVLVVPLVEAERYPNVVPIAVTVERVPFGPGGLLPTSTIEQRGHVVVEGCRCINVVVRLAPGDRRELDLWPLPSVQTMVAWSELIDTAATMWLEGGLTEVKGLEEAPADPCPELAQCGIAGLRAVGKAVLEVLAKRLREVMMLRPIPQLARVRTLMVMHATTRPVLHPIPHLLALRRVDTALQKDGQNLGEAILKRAQPLPPAWQVGGSSAANAVPGGTAVDLGGFIRIHVPSTEAIEVVVCGIAPLGEKMDDPDKKRTPSDVVLGKYPCRSSAPDALHIPDSELYGFQVSQSGAVTFASREAMWAKFGNIASQAARDAAMEPTGEALLSLHALFARPDAITPTSPNGVTAQIGSLFADTGARRIRVKIRAVSSHAAGFATRPFIRGGLYQASEPLPAEETVRATGWSDPIWIPASDRPASPVAAAEAHPAIRERPVGSRGYPDAATTVERVNVVRLWFARPWFSSGEGERLGIVLWPPVKRPKSLPCPAPDVLRPSTQETNPVLPVVDYMTLDRFAEIDLPGAGPFISRWGSDPIETFPMAGWRDWRIPNSVFADLPAADAEDSQDTGPYAARLVENVPMPIPDTGSKDGATKRGRGNGEDKMKPEPIQRYLNVDLLTFTPRFDIDREQWFVDLTLDPGPMISPFVRLGVVRYQEQAPRDLMVSFPGDPFQFQMLTRRQTAVWVEADPNSREHSIVRVEVSGPASPEPEPDLSMVELIDEAVVTRVNVRLVGVDPQTRTVRLRAQSVAASGATGDYACWRTGFRVPNVALDPNRLTLTLFVEERAHRPPTARTEFVQDFGASSPRYVTEIRVPPRPASSTR
ncbi:hypothetical protein [Pseudoroseomonas ludipueritiae]|uniref:Uncharacterized protein n=1 Tax=Pseudoroseomonas ludipueritiae TaxID=198093 RepID=A0ABR7R344_9PROT|nr:hypothetical protein [Pseudoroseomonas ludipueritiae]MBC9176136.1 hypothetical protein [Pseudoroseomonas ludipueritiae]